MNENQKAISETLQMGAMILVITIVLMAIGVIG